jgi:hypothetical protein
LRYDLYTGNADNTDTGGPFSTRPGYGPNSRTIMQFRVAGSCSSSNCGATGINQAPVAAAATPATLDYVDPTWFGNMNTAIHTAFQTTQDPIIVPQNAYNGAYGTNVSDVLGSNLAHISDTQLSFTPFNTAGTNTGTAQTAATFESTKITMGLGPKSIIEDFTVDFGRMNAMLGVEVPKTTATTQTSMQQAFIDPPTELVQITPNSSGAISGLTENPQTGGLSNPVTLTTALTGQMADGTQLWKISHNGVDTHAVHFHLFNVQLVNRVGWDGMVRWPDANETGWKEVVRMNPLEDVIVALRPKQMTVPFKLPNSHRLLDPSNSGQNFFFNLDPSSGNASNVTNLSMNYGYEYLWHCHILGHEENDMMRSISVAQDPDDPSGLSQTLNANNSITLNWTDNSMIANWVTIKRTALADNSVSYMYTAIPECSSQAGCAVSYTDSTASQGSFYKYQVMSNNTVGGGDINTRLPASLLTTLTPNFLGFDNVTASSNWSTVANPSLPTASLSSTAYSFADTVMKATSASQSFTLTNTGPGLLTISSIALTTGTDFVLTPPACASLKQNTTCTITVSFKPTSKAGALTDTLVITDNTGGVPNSTQSITLNGNGLLPAPILTSANITLPTSTTTSSGFTLSWGAITGATGYTVQYSTDSTFKTGVSSTTASSTNAVITGLTSGATYYFQVQATAGAGITSAWSTSVSKLTIPSVPSTPTSATVATNSLTLNWSAATGATSYTVQRATNAGFTTGVTTTTASTNSLAVTGLAANTTYYFRVSATNLSGTTGYSGYLTQLTAMPAAPTAPTGITAVNGLNGNPFTGGLIWTAVTGANAATSYNIRWSKAVGMTTPTTITGATSGAQNTLGGVTSVSIVYMQVQAVNAGGVSTWAPTTPTAVTAK